MTIARNLTIAAGALAASLTMSGPVAAKDLVYGSWPPAGEYLNRVALPKAFAAIEKETNGEIKWRLVPGGQLANPKETFNAIGSNLMQAGLGISTYVPNLVPSLNVIYSTIVFDEDVVAASGAALETLTLNCPSCIEEFKKINIVPLSGWTSSPYSLACRTPVASLADLKGKRVRATGGNAPLMEMAGATPVAATLVEAVGLLQRGGLDCTFGVHGWLKVFGYAEFAKNVTVPPLGLTGPAVGLMLNRDAWNDFTAAQKQIHLKQASYISAALAIGQFILENDHIFKDLKANKGVKEVKADPAEIADLGKRYDAVQRQANIETAKKFGVSDPASIIDAYAAARAKWAKLSPAIGTDIDKFADAIWREIYAKADPSKL